MNYPQLFFCLVIVVHESLDCPEQLNFLLFFRQILQLPQILWLSFLCMWTLSNSDCMILNPSFYTEDNWGTHLQLLQKIQMLTDAPEGKTMH